MTTAAKPRARAAAAPEAETRQQPADVFVVFGITGDLAKVMTFRSLYRLERRGLLDCPIVGVAVDDWTVERPARPRPGVDRGLPARQIDDEVFERLAERLSYVEGDFARRRHLRAGRGRDQGRRARPVFYLEIPPFLFGTVVKGLAEAGLTENARVVVEKPFGHDLESARALADEMHPYIDESQLYRIDHFLGKMGLVEMLYPALRQHDARAGLEPQLRRLASRSRWPRASGSRIAATSTTRSARCATWWSTT